MGNIGNQLYFKAFAGDGSADGFLVLSLHGQKLGFCLRKGAVAYGDGGTLLIVGQLLLEMVQIGSVLPQTEDAADDSGSQTP